jgi:hypothetical protein
LFTVCLALFYSLFTRGNSLGHKKTVADANEVTVAEEYAVTEEDVHHCWLDTGEDGGRRVVIADTMKTVVDANEDARRS